MLHHQLMFRAGSADAGLLAEFGFTGSARRHEAHFDTLLPALGDQPLERLRAHGEVTHHAHGPLWYSKSADWLFAAMPLSAAQCSQLEANTALAYRSLLGLVQSEGYPHLVRIWNILPQINQGAGDQEIYKRFCNGRLAAFEAAGIASHQYPAASAVGHHSEGALIYLLASRHPARHWENPQQVQAYCYPRQYGPSSPSFARATTIEVAGTQYGFLSGTASIVGHQSVHHGDFAKQLDTTLNNIDIMLQRMGAGWHHLSMARIYIRHQSDYHDARRLLESHPLCANSVFALADICRAELLVEIEATFAGF